jgi:hypothetical protein
LEDVVPAALANDPKFLAYWPQKYVTNAMVAVELPTTVDGQATTVHLTAQVRQNEGKGAGSPHAEDVVRAEGDLSWAVAEALKAGSPSRPAVVRLLVNRTPCTGCAQRLSILLRVIESRLTPEQRASIRFELLASGSYEALEDVPDAEKPYYTAEKRFTDMATTVRSLQIMLEAGWDVRALRYRPKLTQRGEFLEGAVRAMRQHLGLPPAGAIAPAGSATVPPPAAGGHAAPAPVHAAAAPAPPPGAGAPTALASAAPAAAAPAEGPPSAGGAGPPETPPPGPPAPAAAQPAGGGEPWGAIREVALTVPPPQVVSTAIDQARQLAEQAEALAADPTASTDALPAMQTAFRAATVAHGAATGAQQSYAIAYQAAQVAGRIGTPAAARAMNEARAAHGLSQQALAEYEAALATNSAAQQGGPQATQHAVQVTAHARRAAYLFWQASEASNRAVAAAGQAVHGAGRARLFASDDDAADHGRRQWAGLLERLSPEQAIAASDYSGAFYRTINRHLRGEVAPSELTERERAFVTEDLPLLDEALRVQPTTEDLMVVRVTTDDELNRWVARPEGSVRSNPAYFSTSLATTPRVGTDQDVVLHLIVPAGTPALFMESTYPRLGGGDPLRDLSQELLLGRNTEYVIEQAVEIGGRWHAFGRVLPTRR